MKHIKSYKVFEEAGLKPTKKFLLNLLLAGDISMIFLKKQVLIHMNW
jgi:hypothetical protein